MSLRYRSSKGCIACKLERRTERAGAAGGGATTFMGPLCKRGHEHAGTGMSLRYRSSEECVACHAVAVASWRAAHPEQARALRASSARRWVLANPDLARECWRAYRRSERGRRTRLAWYAATREARRAYMRLHNRRRYARLKSVVAVPYTLEDIAALFARYGRCCAYCGHAATEMDHVVPLARQGHDALYNLAPACRSCNASKHDHLIEQWYTAQPFFALERLQFMAQQQIGAGLPPFAAMA